MLRLRKLPNGRLEYAQPSRAIAGGVAWMPLNEGCWWDLVEHIRDRHFRSGEVTHGAVYLGFLALELGVASIDEIIGDFGLVHEIAHAVDFGWLDGRPLGDSPSSLTPAQLLDLAEDLATRVDEAIRTTVVEETLDV